MVAVSKLVNGGLLLAGQSVFQDVATPQQASVQSYNILNFLGGSAPYIQRQGYGISTDIPQGCKLEQVQLLSRHGERYPTTNKGKAFEAIYKKLESYNETFKGDLAFLNDGYTYFVKDKFWYDKETSPKTQKVHIPVLITL